MDYTLMFFGFFADVIARLAPILIILLAIILANGLTIGRLERWKRSDALYHAFINATTVGYGDFRPTRGVCKALAVFNAIVGLILTGIVVGAAVYSVERTYAFLLDLP